MYLGSLGFQKFWLCHIIVHNKSILAVSVADGLLLLHATHTCNTHIPSVPMWEGLHDHRKRIWEYVFTAKLSDMIHILLTRQNPPICYSILNKNKYSLELFACTIGQSPFRNVAGGSNTSTLTGLWFKISYRFWEKRWKSGPFIMPLSGSVFAGDRKCVLWHLATSSWIISAFLRGHRIYHRFCPNTLWCHTKQDLWVCSRRAATGSLCRAEKPVITILQWAILC